LELRRVVELDDVAIEPPWRAAKDLRSWGGGIAAVAARAESDGEERGEHDRR